MKDHKNCPHCGDTLDPNRMCRDCLLAEARRLIDQLSEDNVDAALEIVFKLDTERS